MLVIGFASRFAALGLLVDDGDDLDSYVMPQALFPTSYLGGDSSFGAGHPRAWADFDRPHHPHHRARARRFERAR